MTEPITVVLLGHRARVGKDTLAEQLSHDGFERYAFADKLKQVAADLYDLSTEQINGNLKEVEDLRYPNLRDEKEIPDLVNSFSMGPNGFQVNKIVNPDYKPFLTPRRILQLFGQDQRSLYPDLWAAYVCKQIETRNKKAPGANQFVITDFRFPNEFSVVQRWAKSLDKKVNVYPIKIDRPDLPEISGASDISETALLDFGEWTTTLINDGTPEDLLRNFKGIMDVIENAWIPRKAPTTY